MLNSGTLSLVLCVDLILLDQLNEDAVFANLKLRLEKGLIFTYIGGVVVSCNPYK